MAKNGVPHPNFKGFMVNLNTPKHGFYGISYLIIVESDLSFMPYLVILRIMGAIEVT
jgi:hypothetical protein